jgi:hypothetical protein
MQNKIFSHNEAAYLWILMILLMSLSKGGNTWKGWGKEEAKRENPSSCHHLGFDCQQKNANKK